MENLNEAKKLIATHTSESGRHTAKVYRDPEYNEYQVHYFKDGKHMGEGPVGYHDDKEDAHGSAKASLKYYDSQLRESRTFTGILEAYAENRLKAITDMMISEEPTEEEFNKELEITKKKATEKKSEKDEARVAKPAVQACEIQKEETEEQKKVKDEVDLKLSKWRNQQRAEKAMKNEETEPKTAKEKDLAAMGHPKDKITKKDVLIARGVLAKEESEDIEEAVGDDYVNKTEKLRQAGAKEMSIRDKLKSIPRGFKAMTQGKSEVDANIMRKEEVELDERELSASEQKSKEKVVKGMKKNFGDFRKRYGERAKEVMYATATKMAKEETELQEEEKHIVINGKKLDHSSVKMGGVDRKDYPDFADAYIEHAKFHNGKELTDDEYDELHDKHPDYVNKKAHEHYLG